MQEAWSHLLLTPVWFRQGEEVHWLVKNFSPRQGHLKQRLVWLDKMEENEFKNKLEFRVGFLRMSSFLSQGLGLSEKLNLHRNLLVRSVAMLASTWFF